jgi:Fe2+ transport system protein B
LTALESTTDIFIAAGDPSDLKTIRADFSKDDYEEVKEEMSDEEQKRLLKQLREHRELKHRGIRSTNRASAADAMQNANRVGDVVRHVFLGCLLFLNTLLQLMDLYERTGVRSIALFTRGHPDDPSVPHVVDSDETRSFFQEALGVSVLDILRLLEQWSCTRDKGMYHLFYPLIYG